MSQLKKLLYCTVVLQVGEAEADQGMNAFEAAKLVLRWLGAFIQDLFAVKPPANKLVQQQVCTLIDSWCMFGCSGIVAFELALIAG